MFFLAKRAADESLIIHLKLADRISKFLQESSRSILNSCQEVAVEHISHAKNNRFLNSIF